MSTKRFRFRAFVSFLLLLSTLVIIVGGVILFVSPPGRVANWTGWRLLWLTKAQWQAIHSMFAVIFIIAGGLHVYYNWRALWGYLKNRLRGGLRLSWELAGATVVSLLVFTLTLRDAQPFAVILDFGDRITQSWAVPEAEPPAPHAEQLTLQAFGATIGLGPEELQQRLGRLGLGAMSLELTLAELAAERGMPPRELADSIADWRAGGVAGISRPGTGRQAGAVAGGGPPGGGAMGGAPGFGRLTVEAFCSQEGIDPAAGLARLRAAGINANPGDNLRALATNSGKEPAEIAAIIRGS